MSEIIAQCVQSETEKKCDKRHHIIMVSPHVKDRPESYTERKDGLTSKNVPKAHQNDDCCLKQVENHFDVFELRFCLSESILSFAVRVHQSDPSLLHRPR